METITKIVIQDDSKKLQMDNKYSTPGFTQADTFVLEQKLSSLFKTF